MAGNLELRTAACLTLLHLPWEIKIIQAQSERNGTGNAILLHFLAFMAGNEEGRINEACVLQFKVMATTSIQVSGVKRDWDHFIIVLCSQDSGEVLPLGVIIFVLFVEQFIELFLVQLHWDNLAAGEQVQSKNPSGLWRCGGFGRLEISSALCQ